MSYSALNNKKLKNNNLHGSHEHIKQFVAQIVYLIFHIRNLYKNAKEFPDEMDVCFYF